jgi:hypothetical protein
MPIVRAGKIPVMGGFIGRREGTASRRRWGAAAATTARRSSVRALQADAIEIWTDVDGMLTADPRVVRTRSSSSALVRGGVGAGVVRREGAAPEHDRAGGHAGIPVWVLNSRAPRERHAHHVRAPRRAVTAIAGKSGVTL